MQVKGLVTTKSMTAKPPLPEIRGGEAAKTQESGGAMSASNGKFSNELTDAEVERLAILSEELGEAQQCIGKILRHGYESYNPVVDTGQTNRRELERELGDIVYAITLLSGNRDVSRAAIERRSDEKREKITRWLHHQAEER